MSTPAPNILGWIVLGGFVVFAAYSVFSPKKATAASCAILEDKIDAWGKARELYVIWLFEDQNPPATWTALRTEWLEKEWPNQIPTPLDTVVITQVNGKFWKYVAGVPVENAATRADYCAFS
jgi:hypothetical protein